MGRRSIDVLLLIAATLLSLTLAIASNVASSLLPAAWTANRALVWSVVAVLAAATVAVAILRATVAPPGPDRGLTRHGVSPILRAGHDINISIRNFIKGDAQINNTTKKHRD